MSAAARPVNGIQQAGPLPRKVPMRVEPKSFFALERTFLSWTSMAITMASVSSVLAAFAGTSSGGAKPLISRRTVDAVACVYTPLGILFMAYALVSYRVRRLSLRRKEMDFVDEKIGPVVLGGLVFLSLLVFTALSYYDVFTR